ncbi:MAG: hypothetical protein WA417_06555 [Stellaceae bacterium]
MSAQVKEAVGIMASRYAAALSPDMIVKCMAFENSSMVSNLASLQMLDYFFCRQAPHNHAAAIHAGLLQGKPCARA